MRFDIRTLVRTISAFLIAALMLAATLAPVMAQRKSWGRRDDRRHYGWERGRHCGWEHSRRRGRIWRNDDESRYRRRNRIAFIGPPVRELRTPRRYAYWRDRWY